MSSPSTPRAAPPRVVFALTAADRARFLEGADAFPDIAGRVVDPEERAWEQTLAQCNPEVVVVAWGTPRLPAVWLADPACRLRYVCHVNGSVRRQVPREFLERGGVVSNWGGAATSSVAEHAVLLVLAALREAAKWPQAIREARGGRVLATKPLRGRRVGLHGFGRIAVRVAELLRPFGVELRAFSAGVPDAVYAAAGVGRSAGLEELFAGSDVLIECEALTPATAGSVTAALLARLPDDAVFVNVGRGRVVDETALEREARSGRLRVAVDVLSEEPATERSPLCQVPGVLVSPHLGGPTQAELSELGATALANVRRYLAGLPVESPVTLEIYDRST